MNTNKARPILPAATRRRLPRPQSRHYLKVIHSLTSRACRATVLASALLVPAAVLTTEGRTSAQAALPVSPLPVRQVTMFTSGVAYTERSGEVEDTATVPLVFRIAQINDILKSLVLIDRTGKVQPATYASRDPIEHTLRSFGVDVTQNISQEEILGSLRGAKVTVEQPGKPAITGRIVSVERRQTAGDDGKVILVPFLNILGDAGLTSVRLDSDKSVRLLDARLNQEFQEALTLLASGSDSQRRQVTLHFSGVGKREVRVGYVTEAPLWKMSYRLVLGGKPGGDAKAPDNPYLQGWALVENTSDEDWKDIRLSLVSGRPISFIQDLYQPLYLPRPVVGPDIVASTEPQTHDEDLQTGRDAAKRVAEADAARNAAKSPGLGRRPAGPAGPAGDAGPAGPPPFSSPTPDAQKRMDTMLSDGIFNEQRYRQSVAAQASGQKAGALFQYNIVSAVSLPRQQAAMIPVVAQDIEAEKVLLFSVESGRFPLNAVRLHNTTQLHLKGGPVTLFDEGVYAGDARMEDVPPGDTRLISYAVDLSVEGERQNPITNSIQVSLSLRRGLLTITHREHTETVYTLKSKADKPKVVLIEHPFQAQYKLIAPDKAAERTATVYRFAVTIAPGKSETLKVIQERPILETFAIVDGDMDTLINYAGSREISVKMRAALQEVVQRRKKVQELQAQAAARNAEIQAINSDQDRIRKNMAALDKQSTLYRRYVGELDSQETRIENLRQEITRLRSQAETAERELRAYSDTLPATE